MPKSRSSSEEKAHIFAPRNLKRKEIPVANINGIAPVLGLSVDACPATIGYERAYERHQQHQNYSAPGHKCPNFSRKLAPYTQKKRDTYHCTALVTNFPMTFFSLYLNVNAWAFVSFHPGGDVKNLTKTGQGNKLRMRESPNFPERQRNVSLRSCEV